MINEQLQDLHYRSLGLLENSDRHSLWVDTITFFLSLNEIGLHPRGFLKRLREATTVQYYGRQLPEGGAAVVHADHGNLQKAGKLQIAKVEESEFLVLENRKEPQGLIVATKDHPDYTHLTNRLGGTRFDGQPTRFLREATSSDLERYLHLVARLEELREDPALRIYMPPFRTSYHDYRIKEL